MYDRHESSAARRQCPITAVREDRQEIVIDGDKSAQFCVDKV